MGSRERRRAELQKRKRRAAQHEGAIVRDDSADATETEAETEKESFQERMSRRSEERNAEVRAELEPLAEGERPTAVTIAFVVSAILALIATTSGVIAATGAIDVEDEVSPVGLALFAGVLWLMTWGLWRARYWAVLGFQTLLLIVLVGAGLGLVSVKTLPQLAASLFMLGGSGALFYFMIRAMARIQMPGAPGGPKPR